MTQQQISTLANCPTQLDESQIARFARDGYIAFQNVLSPDEVETAKASLLALINDLRPNHRVLKNQYGQVWADTQSALKLQFQNGVDLETLDEAETADKVRKYSDFVGVSEFLSDLALQHPKMRGVLASLLGADALLMQNTALVNPPRIGTGKPWHQDNAYFKIAPLEAVCGVWIALDEAAVENGCMHFLPGWHQSGALRHFHGSDCEILPDRLKNLAPVAVPLPPGGAVFFCGIAPHMTKPNSSTQHRRALQFHYRSLDSRVVGDDEYDAIFAESDGTPASCSAANRR